MTHEVTKEWLEERIGWHRRMAAYCRGISDMPNTSPRDGYLNEAASLDREAECFERLLAQQTESSDAPSHAAIQKFS